MMNWKQAYAEAAVAYFVTSSSFSFSLCLFKASDFFFLLMDPLDIW
jgi:hypothetical protein